MTIRGDPHSLLITRPLTCVSTPKSSGVKPTFAVVGGAAGAGRGLVGREWQVGFVSH